jgi:SAM-dependent methyltransferase
METAAPYDEIADWYESVFLPRQRSGAGRSRYADALGIDQAVVEMLGPGDGSLLEVGCGTGIYGDRLRRLGWDAVGVDLSAGMLRHATARMPVIQGDAYRLPLRSASFDATLAVMVHTDLPEYEPALGEIFRVLKPGGLFVHIGVHPCFCGGFADRSSPEAIVIRIGYLDGTWTTESWTNQGIRDKVGASHLPLADLLNVMIRIGFQPERFSEGGEPTPIVLSARLRRPSSEP